MPDIVALAGPAKKSRRKLAAFLLAVIALLGLMFAVLIWTSRPEASPQFTWLNPAQVSISTRAGPLQRLRWWVSRVASPLKRLFPSRPTITVSADMTGIPGDAGKNINIGTPVGTNADGTVARILTESELATFREWQKSVDGYSVSYVARVITSAGEPASMARGQSIPILSKDGQVTNAWVGLQVDVHPRVSSGAIRLMAGLVDTELKAGSTNGVAILTNAAVCSMTTIPNGGALVCRLGASERDRGTNYWITFQATATDRNGARIKP